MVELQESNTVLELQKLINAERKWGNYVDSIWKEESNSGYRYECTQDGLNLSIWTSTEQTRQVQLNLDDGPVWCSSLVLRYRADSCRHICAVSQHLKQDPFQ